MTWGGAPIFIDPETGDLLFFLEVSREELATWDEILQKTGKDEKEPTEITH